MIPYKNGDTVIKEVRRFTDIPIIVVSAKDIVTTKIDILKLGADDYITKPFDLLEVLARINVILKRCNTSLSLNNKNTILRFKCLLLNTSLKTVTINENELNLTATEFFILELLLSNNKKVFSKANLYESIWNDEYLGDDNIIKTHISNLRQKIKHYTNDKYIETVYGLGYRLSKE